MQVLCHSDHVGTSFFIDLFITFQNNRHRVIQGQVSDGNSYALGGIAGHAGLFAPIDAVMKLARSLLFPTVAGQPSIVNTTTISLFTKAQNLSQSSRALGWDTNDYTANDYRGCGNMSALTWTYGFPLCPLLPRLLSLSLSLPPSVCLTRLTHQLCFAFVFPFAISINVNFIFFILCLILMAIKSVQFSSVAISVPTHTFTH